MCKLYSLCYGLVIYLTDKKLLTVDKTGRSYSMCMHFHPCYMCLQMVKSVTFYLLINENCEHWDVMILENHQLHRVTLILLGIKLQRTTPPMITFL